MSQKSDIQIIKEKLFDIVKEVYGNYNDIEKCPKITNQTVLSKDLRFGPIIDFMEFVLGIEKTFGINVNETEASKLLDEPLGAWVFYICRIIQKTRKNQMAHEQKVLSL